MMKLNIISNYLLFVMMIMLYSPIIIAPWSYELRPIPPEDGHQRTCPGWIHYHGFTLDNAAENRAMAQNRDHILDKDAHHWAAIYAYVIDDVEPSNTPIPETFCNSFGATVAVTMSYKPLKDYVQCCKGWIIMYKFSISNVKYNYEYAKNRSAGKKYGISIWVDSYSSYLETFGNKHGVTPIEFCSKIGKFMESYPKIGEEIRYMPFMSEYDTNLTCQAWIELYEFNDNINYNYQKALKLISEQVKNHISIQYWPREYSYFLKTAYNSDEIEKKDISPRGYCNRILWNDDESETYNFHYDPDKPESFDE